MINQIILKQSQTHYQEGELFGDNQYIYNKLKNNFEKHIDIKN